jgi:hypothetical protein
LDDLALPRKEGWPLWTALGVLADTEADTIDTNVASEQP